MGPPWLPTTLNSELIDDTDFVGQILEVKALVDGERAGNFVGVCLSSVAESWSSRFVHCDGTVADGVGKRKKDTKGKHKGKGKTKWW